MRIGLFVNELGVTVDQMAAEARAAAQRFGTVWTGQRHGLDALTALAVLGREVPGVRLGVSVTPTYPRHPVALAAQARTVTSAIGDRLDLGIGVSHRYLMQDRLGFSFERPARHLREYLTALMPLLRGESVCYRGETLTAVGELDVPGAAVPSVLVGTTGPAMLRVAGELADGVISIWAGAATLAEYIVPAVTKADRAPRVVSQQLVCVTADPDDRRAEIAREFGAAAQVPAYAAIFEREGAAGPQDTILLGDEAAVTAQLTQLFDAGATEVMAIPIGPPEDRARTLALLHSLTTPGK
ncbi:TIGR03564 family F420-dependent LLM class oxidoreductase [Amycolatopsis nigrescens]|uniref:TIGR03564 family F420-dependent LLM class oxidoreductase n=1 Tax=Amycolatopsis nigrescens TaxID=381445 RepID=UPI000377B232|nr:TIGR03564 family F420-dependent LLM class oxidoreductase [Amycolatopsis nigrescens]